MELEKFLSNSLDLDPAQELLDIRPVCHYMMGGLHTDIDGATEIQGVWAAGEAACNSVHGSNRLGANSTSECIVWGKITGELAVDISKRILHQTPGHITWLLLKKRESMMEFLEVMEMQIHMKLDNNLLIL